MENRPRQKFFPAGVVVVATSVTLLLLSLCHLPQPLLFAVAQGDFGNVWNAEKGFYHEAEKEAAEAEKRAAKMLMNALEEIKDVEKEASDEMQLSTAAEAAEAAETAAAAAAAAAAAPYKEEQLKNRIEEVLEEKLLQRAAKAKKRSKKLKLGLGIGIPLALIALEILAMKFRGSNCVECNSESKTPMTVTAPKPESPKTEESLKEV